MKFLELWPKWSAEELPYEKGRMWYITVKCKNHLVYRDGFVLSHMEVIIGGKPCANKRFSDCVSYLLKRISHGSY